MRILNMFYEAPTYTPLEPEVFDIIGDEYPAEIKHAYYLFWLSKFYQNVALFYAEKANNLHNKAREDFKTLICLQSINREHEFINKYNSFMGKSPVAQESKRFRVLAEYFLYQNSKLYPQELADTLISFHQQNPHLYHIRNRYFWRLWFNRLIHNPNPEQNRLQKLSYKEYLLTSHWQTVRNALLLIYRSRCQENSCIKSPNACASYDSDIHVHHLSYDNLGNERFDDLTLLCAEHHRTLHTNANTINLYHALDD